MSEAHRELVNRACRWLTNTRNCHFVLRESSSSCCNEIPDALGFTGRARSISVECKVSKSDYYAERRKECVRRRVGHLRYYMTPPGLLKPESVPQGVGLLEAGKVVRVKVKASPNPERHLEHEVMLLVAEMNRLLLGCRDRHSLVGVFADDDAQLLDGLDRYRRWMRDESIREQKEKAAREEESSD